MSDRYRDNYDSYGDSYDDSYGDYYEDGRSSRYSDGRSANSSRRTTRSSSSSRSTRSTGDRTSDSTRSYSRQSGSNRFTSSSRSAGYSSSSRSTSSTRSSSGAGAYSDERRSSSSSQRRSQASTQRQAQGSASAQRRTQDSAAAYSRSAYGSGSSGSHARTSATGQTAAYGSGRTVNPAQRAQVSRGSYGTSVGYEPKRKKSKRPLVIAAIVVAVVLIAGVGAAWAYVSSISQNLHEGIDQETLNALEPASTTPTALGDQAFYMLLMGIDTSANRVAYEEDGDTTRSDSMILARVDPVNKKVSLISIHRDTSVDMGEYGEQKINAAYQYWGAAGAIDAVSKMAGVPISHYMSIDFDGFQALVDAIGGIEVDVPMEIHDPDADPNYGGGDLDAGLQTLNGTQALILCRSRHTYDDVANDGDVIRAANQRMVISAIAKKILSSDVVTIANSVQTLSQYITTDLELTDIIGLAQLFQGIDPDADIYTAMEPTTSAYIDDIWYEYLDEAAWSEMMSRMEQGLPPVNKNEVDDATGVMLSTGGLDAPKV